MKYRSPPVPRSASSVTERRSGVPRSSNASTFGDDFADNQPGPHGREDTGRAAESWHDSSYLLQRGLEVREISAREWRLLLAEPMPAARRRDDEADAA